MRSILRPKTLLCSVALLAIPLAGQQGTEWKKVSLSALRPEEAARIKTSPWKSPDKSPKPRLTWDDGSESAKGLNPDLLRELKAYAADLGKGEGPKAKVTVKILQFEEKSGMVYLPNKIRGRALAEITMRTEDGKLIYAAQEEFTAKGSELASSFTETASKVIARKLFGAIEQAL